MSTTDAKYIVANMSTVVVVPVDGVNVKDPAVIKKIESKIEAKVKEIVNKLKTTHEKFEDPDFGPSEKDKFGAISFYGSALPAPAGSKYPAPETLKWERPIYEDTKFTDGGAETKDAEEEAANEEENEFEDEFGYSGEDEEKVFEAFVPFVIYSLRSILLFASDLVRAWKAVSGWHLFR